MKTKEDLFVEYVKKNFDYKEITKDIISCNEKVFVIKNLERKYNTEFYSEWYDFMSKIKSYATMFDVTEIYECIHHEEPRQRSYYTFSGGTSFNYIIT